MAITSTFDYLTARALRLLSFRPRSIQEIKQRLTKTNADTQTINRVIANLIEKNLLNDQEFAAWWVEQRVSFRPRGNFALTQELMQKGISQDIIDTVLLSPAEERALAEKLPPEKRLSRGFSLQNLPYN
ncbi:MAG: regulatory protein RecX [Patescibacteria group bacterium]|nr:regulatory protein RecX [Patescibacteria group bacterium]